MTPLSDSYLGQMHASRTSYKPSKLWEINFGLNNNIHRDVISITQNKYDKAISSDFPFSVNMSKLEHQNFQVSINMTFMK